MAKKIDFEKALQSPAEVFGAPEDVVDASGLTDDQKARILRRWEYDASEEAVAAEEGMPEAPAEMRDGGPDMLYRILKALHAVTGEEQGERTGPHKQHGV